MSRYAINVCLKKEKKKKIQLKVTSNFQADMNYVMQSHHKIFARVELLYEASKTPKPWQQSTLTWTASDRVLLAQVTLKIAWT